MIYTETAVMEGNGFELISGIHDCVEVIRSQIDCKIAKILMVLGVRLTDSELLYLRIS